MTPQARYDGYSSCPIVTGYGKVVLAEFDYSSRPHKPIPLIDTACERRSMRLLNDTDSHSCTGTSCSEAGLERPSPDAASSAHQNDRTRKVRASITGVLCVEHHERIGAALYRPQVDRRRRSACVLWRVADRHIK